MTESNGDAIPVDWGTRTIVMGPPGAGKTRSLVSFIEAGLRLAVIITDPGGQETLLDTMREKKLDMNKLYWHYVAPASPSWDTLMAMSNRVTLQGYKDLTEIKSGINKQDYKQFYELLSVCAEFTDDRTGRNIGPIDELDNTWAVCVDSASGLNTMALDNVIGAKPVAHKGEYGVAMNLEERLISKFCSDLKCFFCLVTHIEKEMDESVGKPMFMPGFLGQKLAPKIPRIFSDVVLAIKEADKFRWSTTAVGVDLKTRTLPLSDNLEPSFVQIVERWKERLTYIKQE